MNRQRLIRVVAVVAVIAALTAAGILRSRHAGERGVFPSIESYLAARRPGGRQPRVVVIGLDGATWKIIDPLIEGGFLPTFQRLKAEGTWGVLRSVDCYLSPPAWVSMMTGFRPERTGVYTFGKWNAGKREFESVSSRDVEVPSVWDIASAAGLRVAVTNVPMTHPTTPVNGIMVSGLMTPFVVDPTDRTQTLRMRPFTDSFDDSLDAKNHAPLLVGQFVLSVSTFVIALYDTTDDETINYDTVALKVFPTADRHQPGDSWPVHHFSLGAYSPWIQFDYRTGDETRAVVHTTSAMKITYSEDAARCTVAMTPLLRLPSDPALHLTYPDSLGRVIEDAFGHYLIAMNFDPEIIPRATREAAAFASFFHEYDDWDLFMYAFMAPDNIQHAEGDGTRTRLVYQTIDAFLGDLMSEMPDDATLILASDHGFAHYDYTIDFNRYLEEIGLLDDMLTVDYDSTVVFHDQWCLYFNDALVNREELGKRGITVGGGQSPRDALIAYLKEKAAAIRDPVTGRGMPVQLIEVPEDASGTPPDMIVTGTYDDYFVEGADLRIKAPSVVRAAEDRSQWYHDRDGMYLFWGSAINRGLNGGTRNIEDIAPTVLYLLNLPLAETFDGQVVDSAIRDSLLASRPKTYLRHYAELTPRKDGTPEDPILESLEKKLRALGYVR